MADNPKPSANDPNHRLDPEDRPGPSRLPPRVDSPPQCQCKPTATGRNLVICIDGTANQFGIKNTNVIEIYDLTVRANDKTQKTWYNSGIGTYAPPSWKFLAHWKQVVFHKIDLAIAWEFERTIKGAYEWLSDNYEEGDLIFLFGFSRGAYQVRALAAMIDKAGLILPGNKGQIPFAFNLYADPDTSTKIKVAQVGNNKEISMADRFKRTFSRNAKVHFVGVWDTVSSIGLARGKSTVLPGTVDGMKHVCYFRHALALDERRVKFLPEYAYGGSATAPKGASDIGPKPSSGSGGPGVASNDAPKAPTKSEANTGAEGAIQANKRPQTMEVWFAGTHSDIGGGNVENIGMDRSRPPLRWMVLEARAAGLRTAPFERELELEEQIEIKESLTGFWHVLENLPFKRLTFTRREDGKQTTRWPHYWKSRKIHHGQKVHSSLLFANSRPNTSRYIPKARLPTDFDHDGSFWERLLLNMPSGAETLKRFHPWLEVDLYQLAKDLVQNVAAGGGPSSHNVNPTLTSRDGVQAVYDEVCDALEQSFKESDESLRLKSKHSLLFWAVEFFKKHSPPEKRKTFVDIKPLLSGLLADAAFKKAARVFLLECTDTSLILCGHKSIVVSVAFSPDGRRLVSGSLDRTVRVWDASTGELVAGPFKGHAGMINSVAFSPDGMHVVSGSDDKTVRIWDAAIGQTVVGPLEGHEWSVCSVAFSPDGKHVVSGSTQEIVRTWDAASGEMGSGPLDGHRRWVLSVAFSSDGKGVVSGAFDGTLCIWDMATGKTVLERIEGHRGKVMSVAFSPDGKRVVSGSNDQTVRIWDATTREMVAGPFEGHFGQVCSVAFCPGGKRIVSGSGDRTVRIWDAATGETAVGPIVGHTGDVNSVAFSPDGKRISNSWARSVPLQNAT